MNDTETLHLLVDLADSNCELNHGDQVTRTPQAVDYLTLRMGYNADETSEDKLVIPVCQDCINSLEDDEWTLIYCFECSSSQWVDQKLAKLDYTNRVTGKHHHMIGVVGCPKCSGKLTSLYFLD